MNDIDKIHKALKDIDDRLTKLEGNAFKSELDDAINKALDALGKSDKDETYPSADKTPDWLDPAWFDIWARRPAKETPKPTRECFKCGIKLHTGMMYSCPKTPCPSGLGSKVRW